MLKFMLIENLELKVNLCLKITMCIEKSNELCMVSDTYFIIRQAMHMWMSVFKGIMECTALREVVTMTSNAACILNGESTPRPFDIADLVKVFEIKSTGDCPKTLYHYFLKKGVPKELFSKDLTDLMKSCLRESVVWV